MDTQEKAPAGVEEPASDKNGEQHTQDTSSALRSNSEIPRTSLGFAWSSPVSIGMNIRKPTQLFPARMGDLIAAISAGEWAGPVNRVRALEAGTVARREAKEALPFFTPCGLFGTRRTSGLLEHAGQVGIDLDGLGAEGATKAMQAAVVDPHCRCAFRSVSGEGVRLIFACPPTRSPRVHSHIFSRIADHVRNHYGISPDRSGSDLSRASFVSFDAQLVLNLRAVMLPGLAELVESWEQKEEKVVNTEIKSLCSTPTNGLTAGDKNTLAYGLGESRSPYEVRADGTVATHWPLMYLGTDLVVRYRRHNAKLTLSEIEVAFGAWLRTARRKGFRFRGREEDYRCELLKAVRSAENWKSIGTVVDRWLRWTRHPEFPRDGKSVDRLLFAIWKHCEDSGARDFFLSVRDAATLTGESVGATHAAMHRLVRSGVLQKLRKSRNARHAQTYRLIKS